MCLFTFSEEFIVMTNVISYVAGLVAECIDFIGRQAGTRKAREDVCGCGVEVIDWFGQWMCPEQ